MSKVLRPERRLTGTLN